jgi:hypothetical protein
MAAGSQQKRSAGPKYHGSDVVYFFLSASIWRALQAVGFTSEGPPRRSLRDSEVTSDARFSLAVSRQYSGESA